MFLPKEEITLTRRSRTHRSGLINQVFAIQVAVALLLAHQSFAQQKKRDTLPADTAALVSVQEAANLEAVITTDLGVIRFEFLPDKAPRHVQQFIKRARAGFYDGSAFHRVIPRGIIQGGDPYLKEPRKPRQQWGAGALNEMPDEFSDAKHTRGTVSTVRIPGRANSGGAQFFICASPQPQLDGEFSAFGQVTEGIEIVDKISLAPADEKQTTVTPVKITGIKIEPKNVEPFKNATVD